MNATDMKSRVRLLTTPKLHRRVHVPPKDSQSSGFKIQSTSSSEKDEVKFKCPPISNAKELKNLNACESATTSDSDSAINLLHGHNRIDLDGSETGSSFTAAAPLSPATGISATCLAMAQACSHDHDYIIVSHDEAARVLRQTEALQAAPLAPQIISHKKLDMKSVASIKSSRTEQESSADLAANVHRPVPAPPMLPKSPREGKPRMASSKLRRRYVRPESTVDQSPSRALRNKSGKKDDVDPSCVFTGTRKMSEAKSSKAHRRQKANVEERPKPESRSNSSTPENQQSSIAGRSDTVQKLSSANLVRLVASSLNGTATDECKNFDVTKDELTAAWLAMVNNVRKQNSQAELECPDSPALGSANPRHSTPVPEIHDVTSPSSLNFDITLDSPRPCVTPRSPSPPKRPGRDCELTAPLAELNESESSIDDSAYFSLASSMATRPPTSSGLPTFRESSRPESRVQQTSAAARPPSAGRPPSGGKRVAACSLSSSSSSTCATSSDDDESVCGSETSTQADVDECGNASEIPGRAGSSRHLDSPSNAKRRAFVRCKGGDSSCRRSSSCKGQQRSHRIVTTKKGKKFFRQGDPAGAPKKDDQAKAVVVPAPPKKPHPKRDPLPMRLRALPPSFWQEPNKLNPSPYCVLPPVQPLFRQGLLDDIADIRPVSPQEEGKPSHTEGCGQGGGVSPRNSERQNKAVIHTGDPDLLLRLFDTVEPQTRFTGTRVRRGRPKRQPRAMPPPRLKLDNNPCIIESITEKLFPKLTLDRRSFGAGPSRTASLSSLAVAHANSEGMAAKLALAPELDNLVCFNANSNNNTASTVEAALKDQSSASFGLMTFTGTDATDHGEVAMDVTSMSYATPRPDAFALPPVTHDYPQMLTEVAAIL